MVALVIYFRQKKDGTIKYLTNQIDLFYKEEQKLVQEISKLRCQLSITPNNVKTILKEYRKKVEEYHRGWITEYLKSKNPRNKALWTKKELNARRNTFDATRLFLRKEVPWEDDWDNIVTKK